MCESVWQGFYTFHFSRNWDIGQGRHQPWSTPCIIREFEQIITAGATTAAVTEKVWGEYVSLVCQILAKRNTKMPETRAKEFKIYFI